METDIGHVIIAGSDKGLSAVKIGAKRTALMRELWDLCPRPTAAGSGSSLHSWAAVIADLAQGRRSDEVLPLDLHPTAFQAMVWGAIKSIPYGEVRSYREVALAIGQPGASRAVGMACGQNPVALVIPCHRVIRSDGGLGGYGPGLKVKRLLLHAEGALA